MRSGVVIFLFTLLTGCIEKKESNPVQGTCGLSAQLSGAVTLAFVGNDAACLSSVNFSQGANVTFLRTTAPMAPMAPMYELRLEIPELSEGELGDFATSVVLSDATQYWASSDCRIDLGEHDLVDTSVNQLGQTSDRYQVGAHAWCDSALEPSDTSSRFVEIGDFDLRFQTTWVE